ncbi:MAG TPA: Spy/CpxP family protein refolding chaperone [Rhizomicrobium sp.]|jgi:Spy/CpxP family protein refolding chaperone
MHLKTKLIAVAAALMLGTGVASAQMSEHMGGHMGGHEGMGGHGGFMHDGSGFLMLLKSANLTQPQREQVHQILQAAHAKMKPLMQQQHTIEAAIAAKLLGPGSVTVGELAPLMQQAQQGRQQIDQSMIDSAVAIRSVLTAEQIKHLAHVHQQLQSLHSQIEQLMGPGANEMMEQPN